MVMQAKPSVSASGGISRKDEVDSHSSALTNQRIFNIKEVLWNAGLVANSHDGQDVVDFALSAFAYFAACLELYSNTASMYLVKVNEEVDEALRVLVVLGEKLKKSVRAQTSDSVGMRKEIESLISVSKQMDHAMHLGQQNLRYLFRISVQEPRGLDAHLALFDTEGLWKKKEKGEKDEGQPRVQG